MFERYILEHLRQWARERDRKPVILRGARQVGKTTAVDLFSREFDQYLCFNLEKNEDAELFRRGFSIKDLLQALFLARGVSPSKGRTLLFLDEIQACPDAMSMIRYFYESAKHLYVVAAGSLLETMIGKEQISFPVGRVRYLFMYPLTFEEFLNATGQEGAVEVFNTVPLPQFAPSKLLRLFHQFTLIGGMPEVVNRWHESMDIVSLTPLYQGLLTSYRDDVSKYARNPTMTETIRHAIEAAPLEAGKRIKFQGFGQSTYGSREMGEALRTLERVMLIHLLYPTTATKLPIRIDKKKTPRLQFLDTGLMNYFAGLQRSFVEHENLHALYHGIIMEHIVGQELLANDPGKPGKPAFWVREKKQSSAEVDFVVSFKNLMIPVEVKAGKAGTLRSLHEFMDRVDHPYAVRMYGANLDRTETSTPRGKRFILLNLPYFLSGKLYDYLDWFIPG